MGSPRPALKLIFLLLFGVRDAMRRRDDAALVVLFEYALNELAHNPLALDTETRNRFVILSNNLSVMSKSLAATAAADRRFPYIVAYERMRLGAIKSPYCFEGVPRSVQTTGPTNATLSASESEKLGFSMAKNKLSTVLNSLEVMKTKRPAPSLLEDFPNVHWRAHMIFAHMRAIFNALSVQNTQLKLCRNKACARVFLPNAAAALPQRNYYETIAPDLITKPALDFCCSACFNQFRRELDAVIPRHIYRDEVCNKLGRARVAAVHRLVQKRNEAASRHLRAFEKNAHKLVSATPDDVQAAIRIHVKRLNVDLALVMNAARMADSRSLSRGKVLAGSCDGWRCDLYLFASKLTEICKIYEATHKKKTQIIYNLLVEERFLTRVEHSKRV